jgi:proline-specific peptidase
MIQVESAELNYARTGVAGVTLVVVPGGPGFGFGYLYEELTAILGDSYRLLFYDQRGSGHSTGTEDTARLTMTSFVEDLDRVRRAVEVERINLLGHSFGGLLSMQYAITHPDRVGALVLLDSDPASWQRWIRFATVLRERRTAEEARQLAEIQSIAGWETQVDLSERYYRILLRPFFGKPRHADRLTFGFDKIVLHNYAITPGHIRGDLGEWDIHDQLPQITARTLIIAGDSGVFSPEDAVAIRDRIPDARLVIVEGAGHFPHMEAPQVFKAAITSFLRPRSAR